MNVGVLALQGDVPEHLKALAGVVRSGTVTAVRAPDDLARVNALFMPGGESTTIARLLLESRLWEPLQARLRAGLPALATCAGLILLARTLVHGGPGASPPTFGLVDVEVRRNGYGSQRESFEGPVRVEGLAGGAFPGVFIRAPRILAVGPGARPIAWYGSEVVGVRFGAIWALTFHPELSGDLRLHRLFLEGVAHAP